MEAVGFTNLSCITDCATCKSSGGGFCNAGVLNTMAFGGLAADVYDSPRCWAANLFGFLNTTATAPLGTTITFTCNDPVGLPEIYQCQVDGYVPFVIFFVLLGLLYSACAFAGCCYRRRNRSRRY
jgi:hypothetical protein